MNRAIARWSRPGPLLAGLAVVLAALAWAVSQPVPPGVWHDDGVYLLVAKSLAEGEGLRYAGVVDAPPAPKFPPLYPSVLAGVWRWGPDFPDSGGWMSALNSLFVVMGACAFAALLVRALGFTWLLATVLAFVTFLSVEMWRLAAIPLSEPLFILLFLMAIWAGSRFESTGSWKWAAVFLSLFWCAFHTRTVGVVLLPAVTVSAWYKRWTGEALGIAAIGALGLVPWAVFSARASTEIPEPVRDVLGPYGPWLAGQIRDHPLPYLRYLLDNGGEVLKDTVALLVPGSSGVAAALLAVPLAALIALGAARTRRQAMTVSVATLLYVAIVWTWPFQARRLLVPVLPLLVALAAAGLHGVHAHARAGALSVARRVGLSKRTHTWTLGAIWALWFAIASVFGLSRAEHVAAYRLRADALAESVRAVAGVTGPAAIVGAPELFAGIHLYSGRRVSPSARFLPLAEEGPSWGTPMQQYEIWRAMRVDHLLVEHGGGVHGEALDLLDERCPDRGVGVVEFLSSGFLVRLGWDDACYSRLASE